jgi:hypothetical protein
MSKPLRRIRICVNPCNLWIKSLGIGSVYCPQITQISADFQRLHDAGGSHFWSAFSAHLKRMKGRFQRRIRICVNPCNLWIKSLGIGSVNCPQITQISADFQRLHDAGGSHFWSAFSAHLKRMKSRFQRRIRICANPRNLWIKSLGIGSVNCPQITQTSADFQRLHNAGGSHFWSAFSAHLKRMKSRFQQCIRICVNPCNLWIKSLGIGSVNCPQITQISADFQKRGRSIGQVFQTSNFFSARLLKLHATVSNFTIHPSNF